jgi:hypothetical protein
MSQDAMNIGRSIATLIWRSWRAASNDGTWSASDEALTKALEFGVGGLLTAQWGNRIPAPVRRRVRDAARGAALQHGDHTTALVTLVRLLRQAGIEPIHVKGWSASRYYAAPLWRPGGDVVLCVGPTQQRVAAEVLTAHNASELADLHSAAPDLADRSWDVLLQRSQVVDLEGEAIRVLGHEDHLRLLALHFWRHLGESPRMLLDIAAALEAVQPDFDVEYFESGSRSRRLRVKAILGLAIRLVGAEAPLNFATASDCPTWLEKSVLQRWAAFRQPPGIVHPMRVCQRWHLDPRLPAWLIRTWGVIGQPTVGAIRLWKRLAGLGRRATGVELHRVRDF